MTREQIAEAARGLLSNETDLTIRAVARYALATAEAEVVRRLCTSPQGHEVFLRQDESCAMEGHVEVALIRRPEGE